jgi:hypothetical protein
MSLHTHGEQKHMASASTPQEEKEKVLWNWPSEAWFPSYGLLKIKCPPWDSMQKLFIFFFNSFISFSNISLSKSYIFPIPKFFFIPLFPIIIFFYNYFSSFIFYLTYSHSTILFSPFISLHI